LSAAWGMWPGAGSFEVETWNPSLLARSLLQDAIELREHLLVVADLRLNVVSELRLLLDSERQLTPSAALMAINSRKLWTSSPFLPIISYMHFASIYAEPIARVGAGKLSPRGGPRRPLCNGCAKNRPTLERAKIGKGFGFNRKALGWETGIEPATFGATDRRSTS
jgi:hypothetical protein